MKKITLAALVAAMIVMTGCSSGNQFYGAMTGASVGGMFGSAIGAISGGWHGRNVGTVVGMAVGGAVGAAATAPKTHNDCIDAGEHTKLIFDIRNTGRDFVYDIAPVITVTGTKQIYLSPTAIISELAPGKGVRYTAEVVATSKLKNGDAEFTIGFSNGDQFYTIRTFSLPTTDNKRHSSSSGYSRIE